MRRVSGGSGASSSADDASGPLDSESGPHADAKHGTPGFEAADTGVPAEATEIEELLRSLSLVRLAMAAELSAAAGALDANRPDVAADLLAGAQADLTKLRAGVISREPVELTPAVIGVGVGAGTGAPSGPGFSMRDRYSAGRRNVRFGRWQGRVLAGALAVGLALMVMPHSGNGGPSQPSAASPVPSPASVIDVRLVSSEFSTLRDALQAKTVAAPNVITAGRNWHTALARSLVSASTHADTATKIVKMLREERALLASPAMRTPALRAAALSLQENADTLFARLRSLADTRVLALLPDSITASPLPIPDPSGSADPGPAVSPTPDPLATPDPNPSGAPTPAPTDPVPPVVVPTSPVPTQAPTSPAPTVPVPLPSLPTLPTVPLPTVPALPLLPDLIKQLSGGMLPSSSTGETGGTVNQQTTGPPAGVTPEPSQNAGASQ